MIQARQVPPEYQDPLIDFSIFSELILDGNRNYSSRTTKAYDSVNRGLLNDLEYIFYSEDITEKRYIILKSFPPIGRDDYSEDEIDKMLRILDCDNIIVSSKEYITVSLLSIVSGIEYDYAIIHGSCQGEWQSIYYPKTWGDDFVEKFECEYFNEGSEWIIDDNYSCYLHSWDEDDMRQELAEITGESVDNIVMFFFDGWERTAKYRAG